MQPIGAIAAMTRDRVIGIDNEIPWHYPEDFRRFKRLTLGSIIIMGRKTWESIGSKPLPGRRNIVISRNRVNDIEHYPSIEIALGGCEEDERAIWFIGGGQIYIEALDHCSHLDITTVPDIIDPARAVLFPEIDPQHWLGGEKRALEADPRLSIQQFRRRG